MPTVNAKTPDKYLKALWAKKSEAGINDDEFRTIIRGVSGQDSTRCLLPFQCHDILKALDHVMNDKGVRSTRPKSRDGHITRKQIERAKALAKQVGFDTEQKLDDFIRGRKNALKADKLIWLGVNEASKLITMLEEMQKRQYHTNSYPR